MRYEIINREKIINALLMALAVSAPLFARSPNINKYILILLVIAWFIKGKVSFKNPVSIPIGLYIIILLVSASVGVNSSESFRYFVRHTVNIIMVFVVADCVKDSRQLSGLIKLFFISAGIVCLLGVLQYFSHRVIFLQEPLSWIGINPYWRWSWRITSTRRHPLVFANNIALYLPLIAAYTAYSRRYLHVTGLILMTVALLLTQSRMPLAAVVFTATAALLIDFRKFKSLFLIGTVTIAVTALVIFLLNTQSYYKNRMNLNLGGRLSMWKDAARLVKENPLFGVGLGNVYENIKSPYSWGGKLSHAHNTYLQILVASGIFALISFLWVIYAFFKEMLRRIKHPDVGKFEKYILVGLLFGFAAEGMCGMTDDLFCRAEIYYPIYFLMGLAMSRALAPKNSQDKK